MSTSYIDYSQIPQSQKKHSQSPPFPARKSPTKTSHTFHITIYNQHTSMTLPFPIQPFPQDRLPKCSSGHTVPPSYSSALQGYEQQDTRNKLYCG